jgi:hypothetical protein
MRVVDGLQQRQQTTEHGISKGNNKGGKWQRVGVSEVAECGPWRQGKAGKVRGGGKGEVDILPSFFMGMCG